MEVAWIDAASAPAPPAAVDPALLAAVERITAADVAGRAGGADHERRAPPTRATSGSAGIPAYGVSGIFYDIDDVRAHGRDERLAVAEFYEGLEFLGRLVAALAEPAGR